MGFKRHKRISTPSIIPGGVPRHAIVDCRDSTTPIRSAISNSEASRGGGPAWKLAEAAGQSHHGFVRGSATPDAYWLPILIHYSFGLGLIRTSKCGDMIFVPKDYREKNFISHTLD